MTTTPQMATDFSRRPQDIHRDETRARLRVKARPARLQIAGQIIHGPDHIAGTEAPLTDIFVPASQVEKVKAMVVDPVRLQTAQEHFERMHAEWCRDNPENSSPESVAKSYAILFGTGIPPLDSCEVIEEDLDPPMSDEERRAAIIARSASRESGSKRKRGS